METAARSPGDPRGAAGHVRAPERGLPLPDVPALGAAGARREQRGALQRGALT